MREDVLGLSAMGGDPVSEEYLKAELYRRAEALKDIPDTPLFFGRLDYSSAVVDDSDEIAGHSFHIGRRHVHSPDGTPAVIDWRAPVSVPFYRASAAEPMGLDLRRRFGFAGGELTAYEDEGFGAGAVTHQTSRILIDEIERPRSGPMRDIVATIQPDQDDIVRAGPGQTVCVQGAPGTGKTAVGLHRVAYLLYAYKEQAHRRGVVVVGPNRAFLSYIRNVLPALGELNVKQVTVGELVAAGGLVVRGADTEAAAVVKGSARMAEVLRKALWSALRPPAAPVMVPRGARRFRVPVFELDELVMELRVRGVRYGSGREMLEHRIAHVILSQMEEAGEACDDRTHESVRRSRPVKTAAEAMWPKAEATRLVYGLLADPGALAAAAAGILSEAEQEAILWRAPVPKSPKSAKWSAADHVLIDEARDLLTRTPSLAHVVVDEAQDLSPMEVRAIGRRVTTGAATVLGDIAQGTTAWATTSWAAMLEHLGKPEAAVRELSVGYRVPRQILDYASALLPLIAPELSPASSLRTDPGALDIYRVPDVPAAVVDACEAALRGPGSVAVIAADPFVAELAAALSGAGVPFGEPGADERLTLVPVTMVKGLEFDHVIVVEPAGIVAAEARGLQRLYVALTRAVSALTVLHAEDLPAVLPVLCYWRVNLPLAAGVSCLDRAAGNSSMRVARRASRRHPGRGGNIMSSVDSRACWHLGITVGDDGGWQGYS
jgi:DNA helicase IV